MLRSMPVTLWRHILGDLWRLLLITTGVLAVVIAFAATIKPLADGKLQPVDALKFMLYAMPPMLAYALPFAACFAATMVYHRIAADNEAQAAAAGGVSHKSLLMPAAITGVLLFGAMAALNEVAIPRFLRSMQRLITSDVSRVLQNSINRGEGVELGGKWIYADAAFPVDPKPGSGILQQLVLQRVVMLEVDANGKTVLEGTAEKAFVVLHGGEGGGQGRGNLRMSIAPRNVVGRKADGTLISNEVPLTVTVDVPDAFEDDPKFLTFGELRELRTAPEKMNWIDQRRRQLAVEIARVQSVNDLSKMIRERGTAVLRDADGRPVEIKASGLSHTDASGSRVYEFAPAGGKITVSRAAGLGTGGSAERFETESARLVPVASQNPGAPSVEFRLELDKPRTFSVGAVGATEALAGARDKIVLSGLAPALDPVDKLTGLSSSKLLTMSEGLPTTVETDLKPVKVAAAGLSAKTADLQREVTSKQHERMAMAASCAVMVLTGAITALRLSLKLPLTVYLWSFFPALVSVVTIAGGQQMTHGTGNSGLVLLWGGVAVLALYSLWSLRIVARH